MSLFRDMSLVQRGTNVPSRYSNPYPPYSNPYQAFQYEINRFIYDFWNEGPMRSGLPQSWNWNTYTEPVIDLKETDSGYYLAAELPGMDLKDIQLTINDDYLVLKWEKNREQKEENEGFSSQERWCGTFERAIPIPKNVQSDKISAHMKYGVLRISIPKKLGLSTKHRQIEIQSGS